MSTVDLLVDLTADVIKLVEPVDLLVAAVAAAAVVLPALALIGIAYRHGRQREFEAWRAAWLATRLEAGNLRRRPDPHPTREAAVAALDSLWECRERDDAPRPTELKP